MAILKARFETLVDTKGTERSTLRDLMDESQDMVGNWKNYTVDNEEKANFAIGDDMKLAYLPKTGEHRKVDISDFAFSQLCTRLGVPANYVRKCFDSGKVGLALDNFQAWAGDCKKNMLIREYKGVARAVLSDSYSPFDSHQVIRALNYTVDKRYQPTQVYLSEDRLHLRFVDFTPLPIEDSSPVYAGFTVDSSDVGRGSLNMRFFLYRAVCTNGLVIASMGGTLFRQNHIGATMTESKIAVFNRAFMDIDRLTDMAVELVKKNSNAFLKDYELEMYLEKARRELRLSEMSMDKLKGLVGGYGSNKMSVINSITELAHDFTLDTRVEMEMWAGGLLAKAA